MLRPCIWFVMFVGTVALSLQFATGQDSPATTAAENARLPQVGAAVVGAKIAPQDLALVKQAEAARIAAIERAYPTVVAIYGNDRAGGGSGVLYDADGFVLTNHHVVAAAGPEGWAGLADGKLYRWKLIGTDPGGDVAIIRLTGQDQFPTAPLANSDLARVGDFAMAMGNPFVLAEDQRPTVTLGIVSGVKRFQPGEGMNQLVYGNCIQVDSSINPGNSGGPLFSLRAEILGINGRGSFEERGRVNVGLGYAISANQIKNFVPDLLATKIAQHGTLDAIFTTRGGKVLCSTINFDSPIARAGLELGDELLEFEGETIVDANQFTNILSTLPAGWPACVKFRRGTEFITAYVRLTSLPYEPLVREPTPEEKKQEEQEEEKKATPKPAEEKPAAEKPADPQPAAEPDSKTADPPAAEEPKEVPASDEDQPKPMPTPMPVRPQFSLKNAGEIRDQELNQTHARLQLDRWRKQDGSLTTATPAFQALKVVDVLERDQKIVGRQEFILHTDGRFHAEYELDGHLRMATWNGQTFQLQDDGVVKEVARAKVLRDPHFAQALVFRLLVSRDLPNGEKWLLEGSDKAVGVAAARLAGTADDSESLYLWLRAFNDRGQPACDLLKSGVGLDDDEKIPSVVYRDWKPVADQQIQLPHDRQFVRGLSELPSLRIKLQSAELLPSVDDAVFHLSEK